jgi:hypothetical protein
MQNSEQNVNLSKDLLVKTVKEWMEKDTAMKKLSKEMKELRNDKKELTKTLVEIMKEKEVDVFDFQEHGKLLYTKSKIKSSLSKKHLLTSLTTYFKEDQKKIQELAQHILDSRTETVKENIKRK